MGNVIWVRDLDQPELEVYARLTEPQLRNRLEPEKGIFIAESQKVIARALEAGYTPLSFLLEDRRLPGMQALLAPWGEVPVYVGERPVLAALTGYALTRGVLCAMRRPRLPSVEALCREASRVAVLEGVVDATNVGAIFRSAAALGMEAVLLTPTCCDPLNRRAARVSMGTVFQVPWTYLPGPPEGPLGALERLGFRTAALALRADAVSIEDPALAREPRLAVLLGSEGDGLAPDTIARCHYTVRIPMAAGVDSLNVAAASAVAFWQLRKR